MKMFTSYRIVVLIAFMVAWLVMPAFSQTAQEAAPPATAAPTTASAPAPAQPVAQETKELSVYGEVQDVNSTSNSLSVQYYDYDTDEEKTMTIISNDKTKIENSANLADIKKGDWVDVTYTTSDGKNIAKSIVVEKETEPSAGEGTGKGGTETEADEE